MQGGSEEEEEGLGGEEGGKVGGEAGARAGRKFGFKVGREAGIKTGVEVGRLEGRKAGALAGAAEAMKHFKIGISKEKVMALKKVFAEVGTAAGVTAASQHVRVVSAKRGEEEGSPLAAQRGWGERAGGQVSPGYGARAREARARARARNARGVSCVPSSSKLRF